MSNSNHMTMSLDGIKKNYQGKKNKEGVEITDKTGMDKALNPHRLWKLLSAATSRKHPALA
jgi:hypothetical protein